VYSTNLLVLFYRAGVIGLQIALTLITELPFHGLNRPDVYVLAESLPGSFHPLYTSPWAGGHWRTHASLDTPEGREQSEWDMETYNHWKSLVSSEEGTRSLRNGGSGIGKVKSQYCWDSITDEIRPVGLDGKLGDGLWWKTLVDDFRILPDLERPKGTVFGVEWTSFCINVPHYLQHLLSEIRMRGVKVIQTTLSSEGGLHQALEDARTVVGGDVDLFINATGLAAGQLCGDEKVYPTRGQTALVQGEARVARTRKGEGYIAYTIPRPGSGTTVLGGVNDPGNWSEVIDEHLHKEILERAKKLAPELLNADSSYTVIGRQVGFRPSRVGGHRVELERIGNDRVIHCYGHGGAG
jgi:D-amino-acid oxidase